MNYTSTMSQTHPAILDSKDHSHAAVLRDSQLWLEKAVIGLNLCPFAKSVHLKNQIRWVISEAHDEQGLMDDLVYELRLLATTDSEQIDTTLIIHPHVLQNFLDYNDFLELADNAVAELDLEGELQVASFHPQYQFADTELDDISNASNQSPYPTLHLLRESSIDRAVAAFPEAEAIFEKNIDKLRALGINGWRELFTQK